MLERGIERGRRLWAAVRETWRSRGGIFAREVGKIVLGVLIALGQVPGPAEDGLMAQLLEARAMAWGHSRLVGMIAEQGDVELARLGIALDPAEPARVARFWQGRPICQPLIVGGRPYELPDHSHDDALTGR